MKKLQGYSAFLTLALLMSQLASCGTTSTSGNDTTASDSVSADTTAAVDELAYPDLPEKDYGGYEFRILTRTEGWGIYNNEHLVVEEENGEVLNDAIFNRNRRVEDKFNVQIVETITTNNIVTDITSTVMAGDDAYDLVVPTNNPNLGPEYLVDWFTLDYLNLEKPWWNQNYINTQSINNKLVTIIGSITITQMDSVLAMFYNQKLAADYTLPDLYQLVRDGKWTLPKFFEITKNVTVDINGDSIYNDNDRYAFVGLDGIRRLGSVVSYQTATKNSDDIPVLNLSDNKLIDTLGKLRDYGVTYERDIYNPRTDSNTGGDGDRAVFRLFLNDQALFYVHGLGSAQMYRDMTSDFGVIPTPKLDENQKTYSISPDVTKMLVIPITAGDLERTAIICEALAYEGYIYLRPRYYNAMLQSKYLRDEESVEMLDEYIYTNIGFGTPTGSSTLSTTISNALKGDGEIASALASNISVIQEEMEKYIALFTDNK